MGLTEDGQQYWLSSSIFFCGTAPKTSSLKLCLCRHKSRVLVCIAHRALARCRDFTPQCADSEYRRVDVDCNNRMSHIPRWPRGLWRRTKTQQACRPNANSDMWHCIKKITPLCTRCSVRIVLSTLNPRAIETAVAPHVSCTAHATISRIHLHT